MSNVRSNIAFCKSAYHEAGDLFMKSLSILGILYPAGNATNVIPLSCTSVMSTTTGLRIPYEQQEWNLIH